MPGRRAHSPHASDGRGSPAARAGAAPARPGSVRGGVVGLPGAAEHAGQAEENSTNAAGRRSRGQLVQVPGARRPSARSTASSRSGVSASTSTVVERRRRRARRRSGRSMPDAASAASAARSATSQAATVDVGAELGQLGQQVGSTGGRRAAAAGQQQVPDAVLGTRCRATSAPSPPVPPVTSTVPSARPAVAGSRAVSRHAGAEPGRGTPTAARRTSGSRARRPTPARVGPSTRHEPARVLGLRRADQAPDGGAAEDRTSSPSPTATAPRVTTTSRAPASGPRPASAAATSSDAVRGRRPPGPRRPEHVGRGVPARRRRSPASSASPAQPTDAGRARRYIGDQPDAAAAARRARRARRVRPAAQRPRPRAPARPAASVGQHGDTVSAPAG